MSIATLPLAENFLAALRRELVPALGCTEPIAIAYAAAKAREVLGAFPEGMTVYCSGNIVKNVKGVVVPNSGGLRGIDVAAALGVTGGRAERQLEVLGEITDADISRAKELLDSGFVTCHLQEGAANLYVRAEARRGEHCAQVTVRDHHTHIVQIVKDGQVLQQEDRLSQEEDTGWEGWSVSVILDFARTTGLAEVAPLLDRQIRYNTAISEEGLNKPYGAQVGRTLLAAYGDGIRNRAKARAAAGSDARMGGCALPVVINSGSGNQGMALSLPVIEYARELKVPEEKLYRALLISNLFSIYAKHYIGSLSAFCGAVTAACGSGAAITYLCGGDDQAVARTITNTLATTSGIVCDGAKASCAAKIAAALDAAILGHELSLQGLAFQPGEGIVQQEVEATVRATGHIGRVGMRETDLEILRVMLGVVRP